MINNPPPFRKIKHPTINLDVETNSPPLINPPFGKDSPTINLDVGTNSPH